MLDGLSITFPDYEISVDDKKLPLGHSFVVSVDPATGATRASEYGRYKGKNSSKYGNARRVSVPNIKPAKNGKNYTEEELEKNLRPLVEAYVRSNPKAVGRAEINYYPNSDHKETVKLMQDAERKGLDASYGFCKGANCGTYAKDIADQEKPRTGFHLPLTPNMMNKLSFSKRITIDPIIDKSKGIINVAMKEADKYIDNTVRDAEKYINGTIKDVKKAYNNLNIQKEANKVKNHIYKNVNKLENYFKKLLF